MTLSDKQLEELLSIFLERAQAVNEEYLIRMGEQIQEIGELIPSSVNRLVQMQKMHANLDAIKREIARLAEISAEDLEKVFEKAQETDARFVAKTFGNEYRPSLLENEVLKQILKTQYAVTYGQMANLSQTTISSTGYRTAVDKGIQAVQSGVEDYNSAIRRALEEAAGEGLRVEIGNTGKTEARVNYGGKYTRRLDSAVRMNVLDGIRSLNNENLRQLGEEFGADGVEISAHMLCAEDHLPYQGKQYSNAEFEELQASLPRPFGMWNCRHSMHPILLGISEPAYSAEELEEYKKYSTEQITIDGVTKSRYEWTQQQRRIETAVRRQKDVSIAARAAGDTKLRHDAQRTINALMDKYDRIADAAGVATEYSRMRVSGFKHTSDKELQKATDGGTINEERNKLAAKVQAAAIGISTKAGGDVNFICKLDKNIYSCVSKNITTDEVVITDERIQHIKERHPNDFERYWKYLDSMIAEPQYIIEDDAPDTAFVLKQFEEDAKQFRLILKLHTETDVNERKNSVITFQYIKQREFSRLIRNKKILYKALKL